MKNIIKLLKVISLASIIGIVGGISSIILTLIIHNFPYHNNIYLIPVVFLLCGVVVDFFPIIRGSGINYVLKALNENEKLFWYFGALKVFLSGFIIGVGGSAGKEGTCVFASACFADNFIYRGLKLKNRDLVILTGISGGLAGAFATPLGAAIFSCELIEREDFRYFDVFPAIIASLVGYIVYYLITHKRHFLNYIPIYNLKPEDFIFFVIGAILLSYVGTLYMYVYKNVNKYFENINIPWTLKLFIGGCIVSFIGYIAPQSLGMGLELIKNLFIIKYGLLFLFILLLGKIFATSFTIGSGAPGGLVFPAMCIGAIAGALYGDILGVENIAPYVVLGIATVLSSTTNTPLGTSVLCTEIFGFDFSIPAGIGAVIGYKMTKTETIYEHIRF
ncbi:chloride channel protein [Methanocaldococcus indicus]|uniref:chloride channel protein n=1 Tax=Methanocaldococcus indicus TaxID=213231 RepID=UPI003C6D9241